MLKAIFATNFAFTFGNNSEGKPKLPMSNSKSDSAIDMSYFKYYTIDSAVVMGVKTWLSLPTKLDGREIVVLINKGTELPEHPKYLVADHVCYYGTTLFDIETIVSKEDIVVIGGVSVLDYYLDSVDEISVTLFKNFNEGDVSCKDLCLRLSHFKVRPTEMYRSSSMTINCYSVIENSGS